MTIPILMMEFKGFTAMATQMAYDMETTGITPERVRASGIAIVQDVIETAKTSFSPVKLAHIGGDTWAFQFITVKHAVLFGWVLLSKFLELANQHGIFFLKPSLALNVGQPKWQDDRFLDDTSIETYRVADMGRPYHFYVLGRAIPLSQEIDWVRFSHDAVDLQCQGDIRLLDWHAMSPPRGSKKGGTNGVFLPALLLDNEVLYANAPKEAVKNIIRQQSQARSVIVFGGPVPYDIPMYREYLRATFSILKSGFECEWTVLSYLPVFEARYSYAWLEICRWLSTTFPRAYAFSAFIIPGDQPRPFSFHIYDDEIVHIGLRSFSPQRGAPTMSSAIMFRNGRVADRFKGEFMENWRRIGALDNAGYEELSSQFTSLSALEKEEIRNGLEELKAD